MATLFTHAAFAFGINKLFPHHEFQGRCIVYSITLSLIPDLDVIGFPLGVNYEDFWGHRGFTHSILFSLICGFLFALIFMRQYLRTPKIWFMCLLIFTLCGISHGVLDALTDGGLGVAFFSPFNQDRYFFPWQPLMVSPIGASAFFSEWGVRILLNEILYVWMPLSMLFLFKRPFLNKNI